MIEHISAPAYWASALINRDFSSLDESEHKQVLCFINQHGESVACGEEYIGHWEGVICQLCDYAFLIRD